jgi:NAD+--asparagine ADP-ribosyltransferase
MNVPIIRLELESMKQSILFALSERNFSIDQQIKEALDKYLEKNNIQGIIDASVEKAIDSIVKEESDHFFRYGSGAKVIRDSIQQTLSNNAKE